VREPGYGALGTLGALGAPRGRVVGLPVPVPVGLPLRSPGEVVEEDEVVEVSVEALVEVSGGADVVLLVGDVGGGGVDTTTGASGVSVVDDVAPDLDREARLVEGEVASVGLGTPVSIGLTVPSSDPTLFETSVEVSAEVVDEVSSTSRTSLVSLMAEVYVVAATTRHTPAEPQRVMYHAEVRGLRWRPPTRHRLPRPGACHPPGREKSLSLHCCDRRQGVRASRRRCFCLRWTHDPT
jgi:hypothetical protein